MTTKETLISDMQGIETILCSLEGIGPDMSDKAVIRAMARAIWHILEWNLRRC